ncbi:unnamed protein product, partial [Prorocentrum cordatum]
KWPLRSFFGVPTGSAMTVCRCVSSSTIACLDGLPTKEVGDPKGLKSKACAVCLDNFARGDSVKILPCGDVFHTRPAGACMEQWGQASGLCKTCGKPWRPG